MPDDCSATLAATNHDLVATAWSTFAGGDHHAVAALFAEDAEWLAPADNPAARSMGGVHHFVGRDEIAHFITELFPLVFVDDVDLQFRGFHSAGSTVVVEERMTATLAHGGHYDNEYCFVFELEGGLISQVREYMDTQRGAAWFARPQPRP